MFPESIELSMHTTTMGHRILGLLLLFSLAAAWCVSAVPHAEWPGFGYYPYNALEFAELILTERESSHRMLMNHASGVPAADRLTADLVQALRGEGVHLDTIAAGYAMDHLPQQRHLAATVAGIGASYLFRLIADASRAVGHPILQGFLTKAAAVGGDALVVITLLMWAMRGSPLQVSCILPMSIFPVTPLGYCVCVLSNWNILVQVPDAARPGSRHPPALWWLLPYELRVTMGRRWFWSHVDVNTARDVYTVRNDTYFSRLVLGFRILPGRWFRTARPEALLLLLSGRNITTADVRSSTGETLKEALEQHGYPRQDDWQCSQCRAYMTHFNAQLCKSCYLYNSRNNLDDEVLARVGGWNV